MNSVYIAMSLDGYIADKEGSVSWLDPFNEMLAKSKGYFSTRYNEYYSDVTTVVMGSKTYETILGFGIDWPYQGKETIVLSKKQEIADANVKVMDLDQFLNQTLPGKIWIVGGGSIVSQLINAAAVDELVITVMPVLIGSGVPLFDSAVTSQFTCTESVLDEGIVELTYKRV